MAKKQDPKVDWGFYSMTPRIVRTQYKELSHTEKWLYVCLKDLCGDKGMCYRTLRALAQETDLSTGNLSTGIRKLHDAGLIHAEKKRRNNSPTAKEVWHISIVDIWQSNVEYCSKYEQVNQDNVQEMNNNVQNMNEPSPERSKFEQKRSNFDDRRITHKNNNIEERTIEEESMSLSSESDAPANISHFEEEKKKRDTDPSMKAVKIGEKHDHLPDTLIPGISLSARADDGTGGSSGQERPAAAGADSTRTTETGQEREHITPVPPVSLSAGFSVPAEQAVQAPVAPALSSSSPSSVQRGAGTRRPARKPPLLALTLEGSQVKGWYEQVRGSKIRMTEKNVQACNDLGSIEDVTTDSLKAVIMHLDGLKWVKEHDFAIDIQVLADDKSRLNFEKNWPLVKRKLAAKQPETSRPTLEQVECVDPTWNVYKRPGDDQEWILWQGELLTEDEANERGYAGGGGLYIQTQYA